VSASRVQEQSRKCRNIIVHANCKYQDWVKKQKVNAAVKFIIFTARQHSLLCRALY